MFCFSNKTNTVCFFSICFSNKASYTGMIRIYLLQDKIWCHRKYWSIGRHFLWQEKTSCHRKKFTVTGRISVSIGAHFISRTVAFLSLVDNSWYKKVYCQEVMYFIYSLKFNKKGVIFLNNFVWATSIYNPGNIPPCASFSPFFYVLFIMWCIMFCITSCNI